MNGKNPIRRIFIIVLTLITAGIHLYLNVLLGKIDILFTLNALGYLGLLALWLAPFSFLVPYQHWIRWLFIGFTSLTIVLWVFLGQPYTPIGYIDKLVEVALVVFLFLEAPKK
jgi:hypothetical protein